MSAIGMRPGASRLLALAAVLFPVTSVLPAHAADRDPTLFARYSLEPAYTASVLAARALPRVPAITWKLRVAGGIAHAPTAAGDGAFLLALSTPFLAQYDARGRLEWSARLGASGAATSPIVLGDGTRVALTEAAELVAYSSHGELTRRLALPFGNLDANVTVTPTPDGGLVIASGRRLARLDATLSLVAYRKSDDEIRAVLGADPPLVVSVSGGVEVLGKDGALHRRGSFGARVDAAAQLSDERVIAVLEGRRLSELDLSLDAVTTRFSDAALELDPVIAVDERDGMRAIANGDVLLAFALDGRERFRAALPTAAGAARVTNPDLLLDHDGTLLIARAGNDLTAIAADGSVTRVDGSACADPFRPAALAPHAAVFACRAGIVVRLDESPSARASTGAAAVKASH